MKLVTCRPLFLVLAGVGILTGCIDDNYDLSDIDTVAQVKVKDLVLPLNFDSINLDALIDVNEDDPNAVLKIIDGQYVVIENGDFSSGDITVDPISISPASVAPCKTTLAPVAIPGITSATFQLADEVTSAFSYSYSNVSESILTMEEVGTEWTISVKVVADEADKRVRKFELHDFKILFPKGLTGTPSIGSYDANTGIITIASEKFEGNSFTLTMPVSKIDIAKAGIVYNAANHTIAFAGKVGAQSGEVYVTEIVNSQSLDAVELSLTPTLSQLNIASFTGTLSYDIDNFDVPSIALNNLPDLLKEDGTDVRLVNPQIYLAVSNPLSKYGVSAETGMQITGIRNGVAGTTCSPDNGTFTIGTNGASGYYNLVLAPIDPSPRYSGYDNATFVKYTSLPDMISGNGVPTDIEIKMINPRIANAHVTDLLLGNLGNVSGNYTFYAPLQIADGSTIIYSNTEDGLGEDVEAITIETLTITADATSTVPMDLSLELIPYDNQGRRLDASVTSTTVSANASNQAVTITLTGKVLGMASFKYVARCTANGNSSTILSPSQNITLSNVRATVNGYYEKEL